MALAKPHHPPAALRRRGQTPARTPHSRRRRRRSAAAGRRSTPPGRSGTSSPARCRPRAARPAAAAAPRRRRTRTRRTPGGRRRHDPPAHGVVALRAGRPQRDDQRLDVGRRGMGRAAGHRAAGRVDHVRAAGDRPHLLVELEEHLAPAPSGTTPPDRRRATPAWRAPTPARQDERRQQRRRERVPGRIRLPGSFGEERDGEGRPRPARSPPARGPACRCSSRASASTWITGVLLVFVPSANVWCRPASRRSPTASGTDRRTGTGQPAPTGCCRPATTARSPGRSGRARSPP